MPKSKVKTQRCAPRKIWTGERCVPIKDIENVIAQNASAYGTRVHIGELLLAMGHEHIATIFDDVVEGGMQAGWINNKGEVLRKVLNRG